LYDESSEEQKLVIWVEKLINIDDSQSFFVFLQSY